MKSTFKICSLASRSMRMLIAITFGLLATSVMHAQFWSVWGNAGTNPVTNFLGTTDDKPLIFRVNNKLAGRIDRSKRNTYFGYEAGNAAVAT
ncbi:MAG: hypothetical protein ABIQ93_14260, partial [Saprospiraceae bacterium]